MRVVSLCSGVGLIDLGLEWAGMRTVQFSEVDPYATRILNARFPGVPVDTDVRTIEPKECDVITAGFPCQPFSVAGKQLGDADPRHLWPAIIRSIRLARPRYVILENVPGLVTWGLGEVLGDLAAAGYDAEWTCFNASDVGAPHRRHRWWLVASSDADRVRAWDESGGFFRDGWGTRAVAWKHGAARPLADAFGDRWGEGFAGSGAGGSRRRADAIRRGAEVANANGPGLEERRRAVADAEEHDPTQCGREDMADGERGRRPNDSGWWAFEPDVGRVADRVPARVDRLRCLGNGVVPQCAELVGLRMMGLDARD